MEQIFNKKFWLASIVAFVLILLWDHFFLKDIREAEAIKQTLQQQKVNQEASSPKKQAPQVLKSDLLSSARITIANNVIQGSISLQGARIDDILLNNYKETTAVDTDKIRIFNLKTSEKAHFFESGWLSKDIDVPNANSVWIADEASNVLSPNNSVTLSWSNSKGLTFKKTLSIDDFYVITITDSVINNSNTDVSLIPFSLIVREGFPNVEDNFISHEGFVGNLNNSLERVDYDDTVGKTYDYSTKGGYVGFTDKYWLSSIILDNETNYSARFLSYKNSYGNENFQTDVIAKEIKIFKNSAIEKTTRVFVGPKEYNLVHFYDEKYEIGKFDDVIDFGWFFFFTKPMIQFLLWIHSFIGNFGVSIMIFTIVIRALILPIAYKSYISMAKMKELQPKMKELKELNKGDMQKYNKEVMALYQKERVNPLSGCLPILLQIPIFFSIYKVIFISIEMRHAPFFGWIKDMSAKDPSNLLNLFGLIPVELPGFLHIGFWPIMMGVTMYFQQKISMSQSLDDIQKKVMNIMPFVLVIILAAFPVGLVIYWTWSNIISIIQQLIINKKVHSAYGLKNPLKRKAKNTTKV